MALHLFEPLPVLPAPLSISMQEKYNYTDCLPSPMLLIPSSRSAMMASCMGHYSRGGPGIVVEVSMVTRVFSGGRGPHVRTCI